MVACSDPLSHPQPLLASKACNRHSGSQWQSGQASKVGEQRGFNYHGSRSRPRIVACRSNVSSQASVGIPGVPWALRPLAADGGQLGQASEVGEQRGSNYDGSRSPPRCVQIQCPTPSFCWLPRCAMGTAAPGGRWRAKGQALQVEEQGGLKEQGSRSRPGIFAC